MKKVLLTGATGLIGRHAIEPLLQSGFQVYAASRTPVPDSRVVWLEADLLDLCGIDRLFKSTQPEYLLHFAWETRHRIYLESNSNFSWLAASLEMLQRFHQYGGRRVVFSGTCFEYQFADERLKEDGPTAPASTYARCKDHLNRLAGMYCRNNNLSYGWGRIFYVYSPDEQKGRLTASIIESIEKNEPIVIKSGPLIRDYMYAKDIAAAFSKFLAGEVEGAVNVCAGSGMRIKDYCLALARLMGREELLIFDDQPGNQPARIVGDNRRLLDEVGFRSAYDIRRGLAEATEGIGK